jgi:hypothetical protein
MGYIALLEDDKNRCASLAFKSSKCKRITRSVLAAEAIEFAEGFDQGFSIKNEMQEILGKVIPLTILTDSKTLFDVIAKASYTREKRIFIDLACAREGYRLFEIENIGLISTEENIADGFTKDTSMENLPRTVRTGRLYTTFNQFVLRKANNTQAISDLAC